MAEVDNTSIGSYHGQDRRVKGSEIFVGGLPLSAAEHDIREVFSEYGEIVELRLMKDHIGASKGFCFVRFTTKEAALRASNEQKGIMVKGKKIGVSLSSDKDSLFFGNLCKDWSSEEFEKLVHEAFTDVISVDLATVPSPGSSSDNRNRRNRGFAFVQFSSHAAAARAHRLGSKPEFVLPGGWHPLVDWSRKEAELDSEEMAKVKIAFIGNLPANTDEDFLRQLFEPFGKIDRVALSRKSQSPVGFVHFAYRSSLENAIREMNGKTVQGPYGAPKFKIQVSVSKPDKDKKRDREEDKSTFSQPGNQIDLGTSLTHYSLDTKSKAPKVLASIVDVADPYEEAVIALSSTIKERLLRIFRLGIATRFDVNAECITSLKDLPESAARAVLDEFMLSGAEQHDKRAYFNSLVAKHPARNLGLRSIPSYYNQRAETALATTESDIFSSRGPVRVQATDLLTSRGSAEVHSHTPSLLEGPFRSYSSLGRSEDPTSLYNKAPSLGRSGDPTSLYDRVPPLSSLDYGHDIRPVSRFTSSELSPYRAPLLLSVDYAPEIRSIPVDYAPDIRSIPRSFPRLPSSERSPPERRPQMKFDPFTGEPYKFDPFTGEPIQP